MNTAKEQLFINWSAKTQFFAFSAILIGLTLAASSHAQVATKLAPTYRVVDIGALPGTTDWSQAFGVNNAGQVIGRSGKQPSGDPMLPFIWDSTNGLRDLGVPSSGLYSAEVSGPNSINSQGVIVGARYYGDPLHGYYGNWRAMRWDSVNGVQTFGSGPIDGYGHDAVDAINDSGAVAYENHDNVHAKTYYISSNGTATWIGEINSFTMGQGLNNLNQIVGDSGLAQGPRQAFFWSPTHSIIGLGFLPGFNNSVANCINDSSQAVGYCSKADGTQAAFIWTAGGGMVQLASGVTGASNYYAGAISAGGIVVGYNQTGGTNHAVAWAPGQNAVDINTLIPDLSGWIGISEANAINSSGVIVGSGLRTNGVTHACVLYPIAPLADIKMFAGVIINNGTIGSNYLIQATSSLSNTNWTTLTNVTLVAQPYIYIDYNSYTNSQQFYRAVPQ